MLRRIDSWSLDRVMQVVYVAFCYFAICRQPPPRKKREDVKGGSLSFGGAA